MHRESVGPRSGQQGGSLPRRATLLLPLLCVLATAAHADTVLMTPSLNTTNLNNTLDCRIVNAGKKTISVLVEMLNQEGAVLASNQFDVPPGGARATELTDTVASASCRFTGKFG